MSDFDQNKPLWLVKLGGDVVSNQESLFGLVDDLATALNDGIELVLVHGGGPQATHLMKSLGLEPQFVGGRRVTDDGTLEAVIKSVAGEVSTRLAAACTARGVPALGLTGVSAGLIRAAKRPPTQVLGSDELVDFGLVGDIISIDTKKIRSLIAAGFVPVIGCMASDGEGQVLNINGDVVAVDLAVALGAEVLFAISGVPGVLRDPANLETRIQTMNENEINAAVQDGTISGGMIAKVSESLRAVKNGVGKVVIAGPPRAGLIPDAVKGLVGTSVEVER